MEAILHFETFVAAAILLNITPGNDTIYILTKSISQGKKAGVISVLGISTGCAVHTVLAAFGLSLVISQSMILFNTIKYAGVLYLFYVGYQLLTQKTALGGADIQKQGSVNNWKIYRDAIFTNILNPKVALFFIAFLPQFIDPAFKNTVVPFLILGTTFIVTGTLWCLILAIFAAVVFQKLRSSKSVASYVNKICGLTLIGLGIKVAFTKS
jgi:RhtB (resistance to homoserine/threonine) family protein